ncbi:RAMP superfamily CRISPR-associated protein [Fusobacterium pseudoperiodonticum]|uniref:CRISPR type III-associated protein domain-containing protein n=1 Tax=Fusobacterium pseudoperiodonticum TaxID=2663009 RepID=A0A2D3PT32_9FUSO|nr:RAMP superfamily CRISPR-associated protein [Fusobacterium pseudoperiodonticum]ATV70839.1 hypothetical protein CTM98_09395 [Fusobacterium pseudoperiodonticum]
MGNNIFEVIEVNKKKIELKGVDKSIKVISRLEDQSLKKGDFVKCEEIFGNIIISEKVDSNSLKEEDKDLLMYPFNFVSLGDENEIEESRGPIKKGNYSGKIVCTLTNLTPISIGSEKSKEFIKFKNKYIIPASSLKGEIRNIIEVLTNSCITNVKEKHLYKMVPEKFRTCDKTEHLCFACRLFGSVGNVMEETPISQKSYRGRVFFSDATINKDVEPLTLSLLLDKPRVDENEKALKKFYTNSEEKIKGRKFFWHQEKLFEKNNLLKDFSLKTDDKFSTISCMDINQSFNFEVYFENLSDTELGTLVYALELEEGLLHKIGRAKAYGFGSCKIEIKEILLDNESKYQSFIASYNQELSFLENIKKRYIDLKNTQIKELKMILSRENNVNISYPKPFPSKSDSKRKVLKSILEYK